MARLLGVIGDNATSTPVHGAHPLSAGRPQPTALATMLAQQVTGSGLFYESHLAALVRGEMSRTRVMREAEMRLEQAATSGSERTANDRHAARDAGGTNTTIDPRLAPLVRQQLELLAGNVFQWQGEAWSGTPMRWSIEQPPERHGEAATPEPTTAHEAITSLSLTMPGLGLVEAKLRLGTEAVEIDVWTESDTGRRLLAADRETLRRRLRDAGLGEATVRLISESAT
ncbi:flagellar hook-length control protein FliK [Salinisphaera sp. Q1T1-3]|nr:flagellar hook-length control protein FliK [Salinisphaera sp. Q1T1-3]